MDIDRYCTMVLCKWVTRVIQKWIFNSFKNSKLIGLSTSSWFEDSMTSILLKL